MNPKPAKKATKKATKKDAIKKGPKKPLLTKANNVQAIRNLTLKKKRAPRKKTEETREKNADAKRKKRYSNKGLPVPAQKKASHPSIATEEARLGLKKIDGLAKRVNGKFTTDAFKNYLKKDTLKDLNDGWDVKETLEKFSDRFSQVPTFTSTSPKRGKPSAHKNEWVALEVYLKGGSEIRLVAMFESPTLAARLMGDGFSRQGIDQALNQSEAGCSGVINKSDVCFWQYIKKV